MHISGNSVADIFADLDETRTDDALEEDFKSNSRELRFLDDTLKCEPVDSKILKELDDLAKESGARNKIGNMLSKRMKFIANTREEEYNKVWEKAFLF